MIQNQKQTQQSVLNMASSDSQIDKLQHGRPKRVELPDVNINTGAQSINTERASLKLVIEVTHFKTESPCRYVSFLCTLGNLSFFSCTAKI